MKKILFLIHDLGQGGAEKVLINLVNNMDSDKFDITVVSLFGGGVNEQFLKPHIHYRAVFTKMIPGNSLWMKLFTPKQLHKLCVKECYDIEISYLEGPSARVISGCQNKDTKLVSWIHCTLTSEKDVVTGFRNFEEGKNCYNKFDCTAFVSKGVQEAFLKYSGYNGNSQVLYNTVESDVIMEKACEAYDGLDKNTLNLIAIGTLKQVKGFDRLLSIAKRLKNENVAFNLYILGDGPMKKELEEYIGNNGIDDVVTLLGYDTNPYKYISKSDLFVCSSYSEGFSTAVTEALIVGTPVITTDVSGMKEMLGENNEYGIVTDNDENALYEGIKSLLDNPELLSYYKARAQERGKYFSTENTVKAVEEMLLSL